MSKLSSRNAQSLLPAACAIVLGALALQPVGQAYAATQVVTNCNDTGTGSLRRAVAIAASGDTIDLRGLTCRVIRMGGEIDIPQNDLELVGPGRDVLSINARQTSRVFEHVGTGTMRIRGLSIAYGRNEVIPVGTYAVLGGCIHSAGTVELLGSQIHHCSVVGDGGLGIQGNGGAVYAQRIVASYSRVFANRSFSNGGGGGLHAREVILVRSQVYGNRASSFGGGIVAVGPAVIQYSTVADNEAFNGAGIFASGVVDVRGSSIVRNRGIQEEYGFASGGGLWVMGQQGYSKIVNSTISGNTAVTVAAAYFRGNVAIFNSTISDNRDDWSPNRGCPGLGVLSSDGELELESTVLAGNTCRGGPHQDLGSGTVSGSHNLIGISAVPVPGDTISADPRLAPLAYNGGPTLSHRPLGDSPAIGRGSNPLDLNFDQRGPGFPRIRMSRPDIGAIER